MTDTYPPFRLDQGPADRWRSRLHRSPARAGQDRPRWGGWGVL